MNDLSETVEITDEIDTVGGPMTEQVATALNKIHSINDLLLSVRAYNALCNYFGYQPSIYQLATMKKSVLLSIRNIGRTTAAEIECVVCNAIAQANITKPTPSSEPIGNNSKMHEVLEIISRTELPPNSHTTEIGEVFTYADGNRWLGMMRTFVALAKSALAAPPRNCDVGTVYEQGERFARWRKKEGCNSDPEIVLRWAQTPYKEGDTK